METFLLNILSSFIGSYFGCKIALELTKDL